jgi:uncharacterized Zn-finger protein
MTTKAYTEMETLLLERGCKIISIIDKQTKMHFICKCGKEIQQIWKSFKNGNCRYCKSKAFHEEKKEAEPKIFKCSECEYTTIHPGHVTRHMRNKHGVGIKKVFKCDIDGCTYTSLDNENLKSHKANIHDINVVWHLCSQCPHKTKSATSLKEHEASQHQIGIVVM